MASHTDTRLTDAEQQQQDTEEEQEQEQEQDRTNPFSERFDASATLLRGSLTLRARTDRAVALAASPLDNVAACTHLSQEPFRLLVKRVHNPIPLSISISGSKDITTKTTTKQIKGVLQQIMLKYSTGPYATLATAVTSRAPVHVILRDRHGIVSDVRAIVVAYDKHHNLLLRHAIIKPFRHSHPSPRNQSQSNTHSTRTTTMTMGQQRTMPLTLVRGEHVVLVSLSKHETRC